MVRRNIYYLQTLFFLNYVPIYQLKDWDGDVIKGYLRKKRIPKSSSRSKQPLSN